MKTIRLKRTYRRQLDAVFGPSTRGVFSNLKSNPSYPLAGPIVIAALPILDKYDDAWQKADVTRDRNWILTRNQYRATLTAALDQLVNAAELTTPGNPVLLATTGFELTGQPIPAGNMPKPATITATREAAGEVRVVVPSNRKCKSYVFEFIQLPNPENAWSQKITTESRLLLTGLTIGSQYSFRCAYVGTKGLGPWSDVVTRIVAD